MPASTSLKDPLLMAAKAVLGAAIGLLLFVGVLLLVGLGAAITVSRAAILDKLAAAGIGAPGYPLVLLAISLLLTMITLSFLFLRELLRIVRSVEDGDPFTPANAGRLTRMGWLNLAVQLILFALAAIGIWFDDWRSALRAEDAINLGIGAVLMTLVLFILARVFRVGAVMRNDLEGTV